MIEPLLNMEGITKVYPNGVLANRDVDFSVEKGEIHALMGENGAGKSTLMRILFGLESYDAGSIRFEGREIPRGSAARMIERGIGMVHQHFMLMDSLRVYENIILGREPMKGPVIDAQAALDGVRAMSEKYHLGVDPLARVQDISVGLKQKVELLKALMRGAKLIILDEPTAVLTPQETSELFHQLMLMKASGHTIIFISHKIREVTRICDRITILKQGRNAGVLHVRDVDEAEISRRMIGRDILRKRKSAACLGDIKLEVRGLRLVNSAGKAALNDVRFTLRSGEILGVVGVEGNGQSELAEAIFGLRENATGEIRVRGENILGKNISAIRKMGLSYIPEDRMASGIAADASLWENLIADRVNAPEFKKNGLLHRRRIREYCEGLIAEYGISCRNLNQPLAMLSGGNMQKVVVARELSAKPEILIAGQPTRGIDVGANNAIWDKLLQVRENGGAILLVSSDLSEVLELSDSIIVMANGEIAAYFADAREASEEELGLYMLGLKKQEVRFGE